VPCWKAIFKNTSEFSHVGGLTEIRHLVLSKAMFLHNEFGTAQECGLKMKARLLFHCQVCPSEMKKI